MPENTGSNWISEVRWDERQRPYRVYLIDGPGYRAGERQYISPAEPHPSNTSDPKLLQWAAQNKAPGQSYLRERGTWNSDEGEWDRGINWTNILNTAVGAGIGVGGLSAAGAFGGAAPAAGGAGGALPSSSIPVSAAMSGPAAIGSQAASAGIPLGGVMPAAAGAAGGAAAAAGGNGLTNFLRDNAGTLAGVGIPAAAAALSGGGGGGSNELPPELARILAMAEARTRRSDPLHQAAVQMAFGALPQYGRAGINLPKVELP